jgi:iron-sulfur cluster assembly protein
MITVTERAASKAADIAQQQGREKVLRVGVRGGGCAGFSYFIQFDQQRDTDQVLKVGDLTVICDPKSLRLIDGTVLDFEPGLLHGGFRFQNPRARHSCSCGESFSA